MILYTAWVKERRRGLGCIDSHLHDVTYLSDYSIILRNTQSLNPMLKSSTPGKISSHRPTDPPQKTKDADAVTCALVLSIPGVWRVNLQCGRAVSACIRAHTPVCSASRHLSHPPLTNLTHFSGLHHHLHTDLQVDTLSSLVCLTRDVIIYC